MIVLSLKQRLLAGAALCCLVLLVATGMTVQRYVYQHLTEELADDLTLSLDELLGEIEIDIATGKPLSRPDMSDPRFGQPYSGYYWQLQTGQAVVARSRSLWDSALEFHDVDDSPGLSVISLEGPDGQPLFAIRQPVKFPGNRQLYFVTVAANASAKQEAIDKISGALFSGLGLLGVGLMVLIGIQLSWGLRPFNTLRRELSAIRAGSQQGFEQNYPPEIAPLTRDINTLLVHYKELLARARTHSGNLAHALKTPLSILVNEAGTFDKKEQELLLPQLEKMRDQIDYHLARARVSGAGRVLGVICSPDSQIRHAASAFGKLYQSRNVAVSIHVPETLRVAVDKKDFDEMAGNLIENAFKWAETAISISAEVDAGMVRIVIEDDGPGMTDEECRQALQRGKRHDEKVPGSGLGLSIVVDMVAAYQGRLLLERGQLPMEEGQLPLEKGQRGGLRATLSLPVAEPV